MNTPRLPADPDEREVLAAEYVLGTLDARTTATLRRALAEAPDLHAAVDAWEQRLAPLAGLAPQAAPPDELWERIAAGLPAAAGRPVAARVVLPDAAGALRRTLALWRAWAIGASLAAAALAGVAVMQSDENRRLEARLEEPATRLAVQPPAAADPAVRQATAGDGQAGTVRPAAADAAVAQPSGAQAQGAPIVPAPQRSAPGAVVQTAPAGTVVQPAAGGDGGTIRR